MNKIKFFMSDEDYYKGFKFKFNKLGFKEKSNIILMLILGIAVAAVTAVFNLSYYAYAIASMMIAEGIMMIVSPTKNNIIREYQTSPFCKKEKTIFFDDNRIGFISPFEKIDMKIEDICAYEIDNDCVIILPTAGSELFVINKNKYQGNELNELCALLKSKCRKINIGKDIFEAENVTSINEQSTADAAIPFSFEVAISHNDCLESQKLSVKRSRNMFINYIFAVFYVVLSVHNYIMSKDIKDLISLGVVAAAIAILALFNNLIVPKIMAKNMEKISIFGSIKRKISINSSFIETKIESQEKAIIINTVIPYGYISFVTENEKYFSIIAGSEKHIFIPKRYLTRAQLEKLTELFQSKCRYIKTK